MCHVKSLVRTEYQFSYIFICADKHLDSSTSSYSSFRYNWRIHSEIVRHVPNGKKKKKKQFKRIQFRILSLSAICYQDRTDYYFGWTFENIHFRTECDPQVAKRLRLSWLMRHTHTHLHTYTCLDLTPKFCLSRRVSGSLFSTFFFCQSKITFELDWLNKYNNDVHVCVVCVELTLVFGSCSTLLTQIRIFVLHVFISAIDKYVIHNKSSAYE